MAIWHGERGKKKTGGKIHLHRKKRKFELGSLPVHTRLAKERRKIVRTKGGGAKVKAFSAEFINAYDPKSKVTKRVKILNVVKTPSDPHLARRGIITKGTIIRTETGLVKVTSRPSQHGVVSGILIEEKMK